MSAYLLDTHLLIWALVEPRRLPRRAAVLITNKTNRLLFSAISIAEISIKHAQGRPQFPADPELMRTTLIANDYHEVPVRALQAEGVGALPPIHKDPFDRLMVAQAMAEGVPFVTADALLGRYGGSVIVV